MMYAQESPVKNMAIRFKQFVKLVDFIVLDGFLVFAELGCRKINRQIENSFTETFDKNWF